MDTLLTILIGLAAGLHAALYGAYKDSPQEDFLMRRFLRELILTVVIAACLVLFGLSSGQCLFIIYLSVFALSRIATEFWKLFLRKEPQGDFRIPTQIHWFSGVVHNSFARLLLGTGFLASIYGGYRLAWFLHNRLPWQEAALLGGAFMGLEEALAGAYKDGMIEGFFPRKFLKSPTFGAFGGIIACHHTTSVAFMLLAAIGTMRMMNELLFKMVVPNYTPGKFKSLTGSFHEWMTRRKYFLMPYVATWMLYILLLAGRY
jgi:ABC-type amino acid transport system permease subunit